MRLNIQLLSLTLTVALALLLPPIASTQSFGARESNTGYDGTRLTYYQRGSADQCQADCANNPNCKGYTWIQAGTYNANDAAVCYLMSSVIGRTSARGHFSAVKVGPAVGSGKLPPNFTTGEWNYSIDGYGEKQSFSSDGIAHGSVTGKWSVEGDELVIRWSHGWVTRYQLPGTAGKLSGTAIRPDGTTRYASTLARQ